MAANLLDGRKLSAEIRERLTREIAALPEAPGLDVILVGDDPASKIYVAAKQKACQQVGIRSTLHHFPAQIDPRELFQLISSLNANLKTHGILLQLPLPLPLPADSLIAEISPQKDVDGLHPFNLGRLVSRIPLLRPCTPFGVITLLKNYHIDLVSKHAVVVGASTIVGRPMALELLLQKSTVSIAHRFTTNLADLVKQADILVSAVGKPGIIQSQWIKPGAVVVDVGIHRLADGKIIGDIEFSSAKEIASWITPVPGGIGPMTIATLLENTVYAAKMQKIPQ